VRWPNLSAIGKINIFREPLEPFAQGLRQVNCHSLLYQTADAP